MTTSAAVNSITLAVTGASGIPYALRLLHCLLDADKTVYFVMSQAAQVVSAMESDLTLPSKIEDLQDFLRTHSNTERGQLKVLGYQQWSAPIASGSACADAMVVVPCSSGALSAMAIGASNNLLERAADVMLKERKPLIIVPRETPLSLIHLENMLALTRAGATIMPANPGFYYKPKTADDLVDFMVARILDHLKIPQTLLAPWGEGTPGSAQ